jgi:acetoacetate decarboxylase
MFEFHPMGRYMMPAHFGMPVIEGVPSLRYRDVTAMTVVYLTDRDKLAAHLPAPFEVGAEPLVTVTYARNRKVDFLAGRGYNMIRVNAAAVFNGEQDKLEGQFALVLWENLADPILTGREMAGIPKLFADIPDHEIGADEWRCGASHFGHPIVDVTISNPIAVTAEDIAAFQAAEQG